MSLPAGESAAPELLKDGFPVAGSKAAVLFSALSTTVLSVVISATGLLVASSAMAFIIVMDVLPAMAVVEVPEAAVFGCVVRCIPLLLFPATVGLL